MNFQIKNKIFIWMIMVISFMISGSVMFAQERDAVTDMPDQSTLHYSLVISPDSLAILDSLVMADSLIEIDTQKVAFDKGVNLYNAQKYSDALKIFQELNSIPQTVNRFMCVSNMMIIKTYLRLGKPDKCIEAGYDFESFYGDNNYIDDVRYTIGEALLTKEKYSDALFYYLNVLKSSQDRDLKFFTRQAIDVIIDIFLTTEDIQKLQNSIDDDFFNFAINLKLAEKYHLEGENDQAAKIFRAARRMLDGENYSEEYLITGNKLQKRTSDKKYIGVILPLSGSMASIGKQILNGARYAINQYRLTSNQNVAAIVLDNRGDLIRSVKLAEYLSNNPKVLAVFGPISSDNAIAISASINQTHIPMITPTATKSKIPELGPWTFQANVDFKNAGFFLGKYCIEEDGINTLATVAPVDAYGIEITDAFTRAYDESGGILISQEWYKGAPDDLRLQFTNIRKKGLGIMRDRLQQKINTMKDSLFSILDSTNAYRTDSLYLTVTDSICKVYETDTLYNLSIPQALVFTGLMDSTEMMLPEEDSLELVISTVNGVFLPTHFENIEMIISQLNYWNLNTTIMGGGNWYDLSVLKKNRRICNGIKFISDYYIDENSWDYRNFTANFFKLIGYKPQRFDLYGYDTMQALLSAFAQKEVSRENIRRYLTNMPTYNGICRNISFLGNRPRVNSSAFILTFQNNSIKPVAIIENGKIVPSGKK